MEQNNNFIIYNNSNGAVKVDIFVEDVHILFINCCKKYFMSLMKAISIYCRKFSAIQAEY